MLVMFKYTELCWSITITLDIVFSQQSVLRFMPFGAIAITMLCTCAFPRKIVPGPCVLLFDEGRLNITALHKEGDTWATLTILKSPEYWTQGQQIHSWIREPDKTEHTAQELQLVLHIKVAGDCCDQVVFQMIISFSLQGRAPVCCSHVAS